MIAELEKNWERPLKQATITFLLKDGEILLALKKRGFGVGKWNGVGGKSNPGETLEETAVRESQEEIGITPKDIKKVAILKFYFPSTDPTKKIGQEVSVFTSRKWEGEIKETEEMKPKWFKIEDIPYNEMWWDDKYWLPKVLEGKKVRGSWAFGEGDKILDYYLEETKKFLVIAKIKELHLSQ